MKKLSKTDLILFFLLAVSIVAVVVFSLPDAVFLSDEKANALLVATVPRLAVGVFLVVALATSRYRQTLKPFSKDLPKSLLWCLPCFLVVAANFPFSALLRGVATVERIDLLWLFLLKCLAIGLMEETFFRGLLLPILLKKFKGHSYGAVIAVIVSSALFSLLHLVNLFFGANFGATVLQIGYTFLIGCMFAVTLLKTKNLWLCVLLHVLFDVGGVIVTDLGSGPFQDTFFWIFTAVAGVLCAVHVLFSLRKINNAENQL